LQDPPKFTQVGIFGLKTSHLATLVERRDRVQRITMVHSALIKALEFFFQK
jgi:IS30 family transposase